MKSVELNVGESAVISRNIFASSWTIIYAGMISERVYSVAITFAFGNHKMAYNLFLNQGQREITTPKGRIHIHNYSPERISFSIEKI